MLSIYTVTTYKRTTQGQLCRCNQWKPSSVHGYRLQGVSFTTFVCRMLAYGLALSLISALLRSEIILQAVCWLEVLLEQQASSWISVVLHG